MKLAKFSCSKAIISDDLHRFFPILIIETLLLQVFATMPLASTLSMYHNINPPYEVISSLDSAVGIVSSPLLPLFMGILLSVCLFGYLNKEKEAYSLHAFPFRRETLFFSHYISGLLFLLLPVFLTYGLLEILNIFYHIGCGQYLLHNILVVTVELLFFFHLGCATMMLTGNSLIAVVLYFVINGLSPGFCYLLDELRSIYIYGLQQHLSLEAVSTNLSPVVYFSEKAESVWNYLDDFDYFTSKSGLSGLGYLPIYILVGVVLLIVAVILYQKRPIEEAGETMVFSFTKPIFRIVFTFCSSIIMTLTLYNLGIRTLMQYHTYTEQFPCILVLMIISGILSYLLSNVVLYRSFHILKYTSRIRCCLLIAAMLGVLIVTNKNTLPITKEGDDILTAEISNWNSGDERNPSCYKIDPQQREAFFQLLEEVMEVGQNQAIIRSRDGSMAGSFYIVVHSKDSSGRMYQLDNLFVNSQTLTRLETTLPTLGETIPDLWMNDTTTE